MKAIRTGAKPSTLDALEWVDIDAAAAPGPGEITVDLKASSLNYHDYAVVLLNFFFQILDHPLTMPI